MFKKSNLLFLLSTLFLVASLSVFNGNELHAQEDGDLESCPTCMEGRRKHIRACLSIWGNFSAGEPGGFLATGNKTVCRKDDLNSCDASWLTGCESRQE